MTTLQKLQAKLTSTTQTQNTYRPVPPTHNSPSLGLGGKVWITKYQPTTTTKESK